MKDIIHEINMITWPSKTELAQKSGIVLAFCAFFTCLIGAVDLLFTKMIILIRSGISKIGELIS